MEKKQEQIEDIQREKNYKFVNKFFTFTLIIVLMSASFVLGFLTSKGVNISLEDKLNQNSVGNTGKELIFKFGDKKPQDYIKDKNINFNIFWDTWEFIKTNYVDNKSITDKQLFYGAMQGMLSSLKDPYSIFMEPKTAKEFQQSLNGSFEGIGAEIGIKKDILTIISPLSGMPAEKAGLRAGDKILAINGKSTAGIYLYEAVRKIRGKKGTKVTLTIMRNGMKKAKDVTITRGTIIVKSVNWKIIKNNIAYIKISDFVGDASNKNSTKELFDKAAKEIIKNKKIKGIILDLRNNPGGYLDTAVSVASHWIKSGVIVQEKFNNNKINNHYAIGNAELNRYKTVVLVNQGSASASEIVSGALQDYGLAEIVGNKTFGKGCVQTLQKLSDGSYLKLTVAEWFTPRGRNINKEGIIPDIKVDLTEKDYNNNKDPQLDKAINILEK